MLKIDQKQLDDDLGPSFYPLRGGLDTVPPEGTFRTCGEAANPSDPVLYRLHEALLLYGHPIKDLINEKVRRAPRCVALTSSSVMAS